MSNHVIKIVIMNFFSHNGAGLYVSDVKLALIKSFLCQLLTA